MNPNVSYVYLIQGYPAHSLIADLMNFTEPVFEVFLAQM
jgi:hypothetical protein